MGHMIKSSHGRADDGGETATNAKKQPCLDVREQSAKIEVRARA